MSKGLVLIFVVVLLAAGCAKRENKSDTNSTGTKPNQVEKVKPAPGTGNVQGKVLYNAKPVENIDVKLCETFSRYLSGCGGKVYTARSDKDGDYVITNVPPKEYEGLTVRVFDTDSYVFATTGVAGLSVQKYNVEADKTLFVDPTHLFKDDLKVSDPKAGSSITTQDVEFKWEAYPDASYYKLTLTPDDHLSESRIVNQRVEATSFKSPKPLDKGGYQWRVEAFNAANRKLSESADGITFTIK